MGSWNTAVLVTILVYVELIQLSLFISILGETIDLHNGHLLRVSKSLFMGFHLFLKEDRFSECFEFHDNVGWPHGQLVCF